MRLPLLAVLAALAVPTAAAAQTDPPPPADPGAEVIEIPKPPATAWVGMAMEQSTLANEVGRMVSALVVTSVAAGSPAEAAGLQVDDELVAIDGCDLRGREVCVHWRRLVPGQPYRLRVRNGGVEREVTLVPAPPRAPAAAPSGADD